MSTHRAALTLARCSVAAHRPRLRRRGVPALRTPFRRVLAPPAASRPPTAIGRDGNAFLRFAPTLNSAWSFHCARKLACGSPCFIGLTTACFRHWRRPPCAPALRLRGVPCLRTSCARHFSPSGLHLFASICSRKIPEMTYTPSFLIRTSFFQGFVNALSARMALSFSLCPKIGKKFF